MRRGSEVPNGTLIRLPNGYYNRKTDEGWILVHRAVMQEHLGRPLLPSERVYFTNPSADKANPQLEDLEVRIVKRRTIEAKRKRLAVLRAETEQLLKEIDEDVTASPVDLTEITESEIA
jgi:ribosomal protein L17